LGKFINSEYFMLNYITLCTRFWWHQNNISPRHLCI